MVADNGVGGWIGTATTADTMTFNLTGATSRIEAKIVNEAPTKMSWDMNGGAIVDAISVQATFLEDPQGNLITVANIATTNDIPSVPITEVQVNGTALTPSSGAVNVSVPTAVSQLTNDSGFITSVPTPNEIQYLTTAPSADNTSGNLKIVVLSAEPATYYNGYIYYITEA